MTDSHRARQRVMWEKSEKCGAIEDDLIMQKQRGQQTWVQRARSFAHRLRIERTRPGHRSLIIYAQCEYTCLRLAGLLINWKRFIHANQLHEKKNKQNITQMSFVPGIFYLNWINVEYIRNNEILITCNSEFKSTRNSLLSARQLYNCLYRAISNHN